MYPAKNDSNKAFKTTTSQSSSSKSSSFQDAVNKDTEQALKTQGIYMSANHKTNSSSQLTQLNDCRIALFQASHVELVQGNLLPPSFQQGDILDIKEMDSEKMDIKYHIAMPVHRATSIMKKYGKNSFRDSNSKSIGFDKDQFRCYNWNELGHFAIECNNSTKPTNDIKITEASDSEWGR